MSELEKYLRTLPLDKLKEVESKLATESEIKQMMKQIDALNEVYHPGRGSISSIYRRGQSGNRGELRAYLNTEIMNLAEAMRLKVEIANLPTRLKAQHDLETALNQNQAVVAELATSRGMSTEVYSQYLLMQMEIDKTIAIDEAEKSTRIKASLIAKLIDARSELKHLKAEQAKKHEIKATQEYIESLEHMVETFWGKTFSKR